MITRLLQTLRLHASLVVLFVVLTGSLALNVSLGLRLQQAPAAVFTSTIREQSTLGPIAAIDVGGRDREVAFDDPRTTVLYIMSPTCAWCKRNLANVNALAKAAAGKYRFVALSNTDAEFQTFVGSHALPFEVLRVNSLKNKETADLDFIEALGATPQTIVSRPGGKVEKVWMGAWDSDSQREVEQFFDVALPGLVAVH